MKVQDLLEKHDHTIDESTRSDARVRIEYIDHDICVQVKDNNGEWHTKRKFNELSSDSAYTNAHEYKRELEKTFVDAN